MKLYYAPGACSLATRICLNEAGISAEFERVDIRSKVTETGQDYSALNPKGSVPMLVLDGGESITENVAILDLLAEREPKLGLDGPLGRTRLIEMLSFLSSELHVAFKPFFHSATDLEEARAREAVTRLLGLLPDSVGEVYLFGPDFSVADAYLFAMLRWASAFNVPMPTEMFRYFERVGDRSAVRRALAEEGLGGPSSSSATVPPVIVAA